MTAAIALLWQARSTNGRWGLAIVGPEGTELPCQGSIRHLGEVEGIDTWLVEPGETGTWVVTAGAVTIHGGATVVVERGLQSNNYASVLILGPQAVVEHHGYKGRYSNVIAYVNGQEQQIPGPVLLAMGLIQGSDMAQAVAIPPPEPLQWAMAAAFARLK